MDNQHNGEACAWTPCAAGTIRELAQRLRAAQRRRTIFRVGRVLAIVAVLTTSAWAANGLLRYRDQHPGSLSCAEVRANLVAYRAGELPKTISENIARHLTTCTTCRRLWKSLVLTYGVGFQMRNHTEISDRPATFVIDRDGAIRYDWRAKSFADRPPADMSLAELKKLP